jgi:hypothetical protein
MWDLATAAALFDLILALYVRPHQIHRIMSLLYVFILARCLCVGLFVSKAKKVRAKNHHFPDLYPVQVQRLTPT